MFFVSGKHSSLKFAGKASVLPSEWVSPLRLRLAHWQQTL